jgi:putative MATE family efflux protein
MSDRKTVIGAQPARTERDWTKGSITAAFLSLSWPMVVSGVLDIIGPTIDMIWIGRLGEASIAGVGVSGMVVSLVNSMTMGIFTGMRAMIARYFGGGDTAKALHTARQAFVVGIAFSLLIAAIGLFFANQILILLGVAPDVVHEGAAYLRINFIGIVTMTFRMLSESAMQASGDAIRPMRIAIFFRIFHVILCPFLVFGWWIFPNMGVSGAALTGVLSTALGAGIGLWYLFTGRTRLKIDFNHFRLDFVVIWHMVRIGIPASITFMERTFGQLILMWFVVPFGTVAVAAYTVGQRIDYLVMNPFLALGQGAGTVAAQNLGAYQPQRAVRTGWIAIFFSSAICLLIVAALLLWAEPISRIFTPSQDLIDASSLYIRIQAAAYAAFGFTMVISQILNGVGDTLPVMLITLGGMWLIQVPVSFVLSRYTSLGVTGVWWGMVAGVLSRLIVYIVYFQSGKWKTRSV